MVQDASSSAKKRVRFEGVNDEMEVEEHLEEVRRKPKDPRLKDEEEAKRQEEP